MMGWCGPHGLPPLPGLLLVVPLCRSPLRVESWVTWQWLPAVREPREREALPSKA